MYSCFLRLRIKPGSALKEGHVPLALRSFCFSIYISPVFAGRFAETILCRCVWYNASIEYGNFLEPKP